MPFERDGDSKPKNLPPKGPEDAFEDIWGQVEGPSDEEDEEPEANSEAFTEFAASPGNYMRSASLRRQPTPEPATPGQKDTADDVRSLVDKAMEEALPTHSALAFPEDGTPTLRPHPAADEVPKTLASPPREPDPEPESQPPAPTAAPPFRAVPAELSFASAPEPDLAHKPAQDLSHLTSDLSVDVSQTEDPLDGDDRSMQAPFEPRIAHPVAEPALTPSDLLNKVEPKNNAPLLISLAVALIGLLMILVVKSLL